MSYVRFSEKFPSWDELPVAPRVPTPEEVAELRTFAIKLLKRQLEHPELSWLDHQDLINLLNDEATLGNVTFLQSAFKAETYFELKDELANKGIEIFNPEVEKLYCSYAVMHERAVLMADYLLEHRELIPDGVTKKMVLIAADGYLIRCLADAWCYVYQLSLAGVEFYTLDRNDPKAAYVHKLLSKLTTLERL